MPVVSSLAEVVAGIDAVCEGIGWVPGPWWRDSVTRPKEPAPGRPGSGSAGRANCFVAG